MLYIFSSDDIPELKRQEDVVLLNSENRVGDLVTQARLCMFITRIIKPSLNFPSTMTVLAMRCLSAY